MSGFLDAVDYPLTVNALEALFGGRASTKAGYARTSTGAQADLSVLEAFPRSTSERATLQILRGINGLERHGGGFPGRGTGAATDAVDAVRLA